MTFSVLPVLMLLSGVSNVLILVCYFVSPMLPTCNSLFVSYIVITAFYPRDAMLARVIAIATCLSVCLSVRLSVRPSRAGIVSKRKKLAA